MNDLIQKLKDEAGLTEEQCHKALSAITNYIKEKLPPMMHPMIDNFLNAPAKPAEDTDFMG